MSPRAQEILADPSPFRLGTKGTQTLDLSSEPSCLTLPGYTVLAGFSTPGRSKERRRLCSEPGGSLGRGWALFAARPEGSLGLLRTHATLPVSPRNSLERLRQRQGRRRPLKPGHAPRCPRGTGPKGAGHGRD